MGFEPTISTVTGWRAFRAAPRGHSFSVAAVARLRATRDTPRSGERGYEHDAEAVGLEPTSD